MTELHYHLHGLGLRVAADAPALLVQRLDAFLVYFGLEAGAAASGAPVVELLLTVGSPPCLAADDAWTPIAGMGFAVLGDGSTIAARARAPPHRGARGRGRAARVVAAAEAAAGALHPNLVSYALLTLFRQRELYPLHAAGAAWRGVGLVIVADSGAGKSTLAMTLLDSGWSLLSDDSLLLAPGPTGVEALALRRDLLLAPDAGRDATRLERGPWPDAGKLRLDLRARFPHLAAERCMPRALVFPELVAQPRSRLQPCPPAEALNLLAHHGLVTELPAAGAARDPAALAALVRQCTAHRLLAARDLLAERDLAARLLAPLCDTARDE